MKTIFMTGFPGFLAEQLTNNCTMPAMKSIIFIFSFCQRKGRAEQSLKKLFNQHHLKRERATIIFGAYHQKRFGDR